MKLNLSVFLSLLLLFSCANVTEEYVCTPCDLSCDELTFYEAGSCPHCNMALVKKSTLVPEKALTLNEIKINHGAGKFLIEGGFQKEKTIVVHYYKPEGFSATSPILIVIPGAGRNGDDYRDAWIDISIKYNVLVLSPEYSEANYPEFWSYNLAGMIKDVEINTERTAMTSFKINDHSDQWLYNDFDRIFDLVRSALTSTVESYDMFGHSAGGQILHRFAIFNPENKANRILAANSGWYTVPLDTEDFPYGLKGSATSSKSVDFNSNLVIFLGEKDDANETRGELRRSLEVDKQGLHRLSRGLHFYNESKKIAGALNLDFKWKLEIIPNVGHDYVEMSNAAGEFLFKHDK